MRGFQRIIFGSFTLIGEPKIFSAYETDNPDQLTNIAPHFVPVTMIKFEPINESTRAVELYRR